MDRGCQKAAGDIEEQVIEKIRDLPLRSQRKCWSVFASLKGKDASKEARGASYSGCGRPTFIKTEEDIAEARREMGGNFPRDRN